MICRHLRRMQILSKRRPPPPKMADGAVFQSARGFGPRSPPPVSVPDYEDLSLRSRRGLLHEFLISARNSQSSSLGKVAKIATTREIPGIPVGNGVQNSILVLYRSLPRFISTEVFFGQVLLRASRMLPRLLEMFGGLLREGQSGLVRAGLEQNRSRAGRLGFGRGWTLGRVMCGLTKILAGQVQVQGNPRRARPE